MVERLVIIGDVHGDSQRLSRMLRKIAPLHRRVVMLGDYVDRGPQSAAVIDTLVVAKASMGEKLVLLAGNHETGLLRYLDEGDFMPFASMGGMATIRSYVGIARGDVHSQFRHAFPSAHERLLREGLLTHYETEGLLLSHAGFDPKHPGLRSRVALVDTAHPDLFEGDLRLPRVLVVCGHYVQQSGRPFERGGLIALDTGCGTIGGPLTGLMLPERTFVST